MAAVGQADSPARLNCPERQKARELEKLSRIHSTPGLLNEMLFSSNIGGLVTIQEKTEGARFASQKINENSEKRIFATGSRVGVMVEDGYGLSFRVGSVGRQAN